MYLLMGLECKLKNAYRMGRSRFAVIDVVIVQMRTGRDK